MELIQLIDGNSFYSAAGYFIKMTTLYKVLYGIATFGLTAAIVYCMYFREKAVRIFMELDTEWCQKNKKRMTPSNYLRDHSNLRIPAWNVVFKPKTKKLVNEIYRLQKLNKSLGESDRGRKANDWTIRSKVYELCGRIGYPDYFVTGHLAKLESRLN